MIGLIDSIARSGEVHSELIPGNHNLAGLLSEQQKIGFHNFLLGFWSTGWGSKQEKYGKLRGF